MKETDMLIHPWDAATGPAEWQDWLRPSNGGAWPRSVTGRLTGTGQDRPAQAQHESTDRPGIRGLRTKDLFAGADLWTDPDMTRATLPDGPTRRTGQYARIRAMTDAVN